MTGSIDGQNLAPVLKLHLALPVPFRFAKRELRFITIIQQKRLRQRRALHRQAALAVDQREVPVESAPSHGIDKPDTGMACSDDDNLHFSAPGGTTICIFIS